MLILSLVACGQADVEDTAEDSEEVVLVAESEEDEEAVDKNLMGDEEEAVEATSSDVDIDLTAMSSTMVYAEVYNIMMSPKDYIGKNIKMSGECVITPNEDFSKNYYACLIKDATACCSQGLEFELEDENSYPEEGETVTVSGVFETYEENGTLFCHLENAKLYN
jgi:hypothetical protein